MELAIFKYTLITSGVISGLIALFVFIRLTDWVTWLKGNIPMLALALSVYFIVSGIALLPYQSVSSSTVMSASVHQLADGRFKLVVDNGIESFEHTGLGDQWQSRVQRVTPGWGWRLFAMPEQLLLKQLRIEKNSFDPSLPVNPVEIYNHQAMDITGILFGFSSEQVLSRQLPLVDGAIYGLQLRKNKMMWTPINEVAEAALK